MNRDLTLAVLSMDAYFDGQSLGLATKIQSQSADGGFAAVAYNYNGETIISYRGTDGGSDVLNGWVGGLGFNATQAGLAVEFYRDVVWSDSNGGTDFPYSTAGSVTFTGHSLGGGLAGLMGSLYGAKAVMFDNMAFRSAATSISANAVYDLNLMFDVYGTATPVAPNSSGVFGHRMDGQFLNFQSEGEMVGLNVDWGLGPFDLHSIALLVLNMYAEQQGLISSDAKAMTKYIGTELLAEGRVTDIAYSVVDEGTMPKGNVAAHDLFDDMADVGQLILANKNMAVGADGEDNKKNLGEIIVEFANLHADGKAMAASGQTQFGVFHKGEQGLFLSLDDAAWGTSVLQGWSDMKSHAIEQITATGNVLPAAAKTILDNVNYAYFHNGGTIDLALNGDNPLVRTGQLDDLENAGGVVFGSNEDDNITGGNGNDFIRGGDGRDVLSGASGNDALLGGRGNDTLVGGDGVDILLGGESSDVLILGNIDGVNAPGSVTGSEVIDGDAGSDYLVVTGAVGSTVTVGKGDADDRLLVHASLLGLPDAGGGKFGMFALLGGVYEATPWSNDYDVQIDFNKDSNLLTDEQGREYRTFRYEDDKYVFFGQYSPESFGVEYRQYTNGGQLDILISRASAGDDQSPAGALVLVETIIIENFRNGDYGITLPDVFLPFGTVLKGFYAGGYNEIYGGYDVAAVAAYNKAVNAISATALTFSLASDGALQGPALRSAFSASLATPEITADHLVIAIDGSDRADTLQGNGVFERISGGAGNDIISGGSGADQLDGGDGVDTLDYTASAAGVSVDLGLGTASGGDAQGDSFVQFEYVFGSQQADQLTGDDGINRLVGNGGNDLLNGGAGNDILIGGAGADTFIGGSGDRDVADYRGASSGISLNLVTGGTIGEAAGDSFSGIEYVYGSAFNDTIIGNTGINRLVGDAGNDILNGGDGNDILVGGTGADTLIGGDGGQDAASYQDATAGVIVNLVSGGAGGEAAGDTYNGIEYVYGSAFNDTITGDAAINRLTGGTGNDTLNGAAGNDYLLGELGNDVVTGGAGADVFVFDKSFGQDTITDFWAGTGRTDRIWITNTSIQSFADVLSHSVNSAGGVVFTVSAEDRITFSGITVAQLVADDFLFV